MARIASPGRSFSALTAAILVTILHELPVLGVRRSPCHNTIGRSARPKLVRCGCYFCGCRYPDDGAAHSVYAGGDGGAGGGDDDDDDDDYGAHVADDKKALRRMSTIRPCCILAWFRV